MPEPNTLPPHYKTLLLAQENRCPNCQQPITYGDEIYLYRGQVVHRVCQTVYDLMGV